jgi:hypothetical protein
VGEAEADDVVFHGINDTWHSMRHASIDESIDSCYLVSFIEVVVEDDE